MSLFATYWVDVILPLPVHSPFTYAWEGEVKPQLGLRVNVSFGRQACVMAVVVAVRETCPKGMEVKPILKVLDTYPRITLDQLDQWRWMSSYYMCPPGQVMGAALPAFFKPGPEDEGPFRITDGKTAHLRWHLLKSEDGGISKAFEGLSRAPAQSKLLLGYFQIAMEWEEADDNRYPWVARKDLMDATNGSAPQVHALIGKGLLEVSDRLPVQLLDPNRAAIPLPDLSDNQSIAHQGVLEGLSRQQPVLLHGVTGSGKTEIYLHLITRALESGQHSLLMVPEIALTVQLQRRIHEAIGMDRVRLYHSKISESARRDLWEHLLNPDAEPIVVLGARSSIFLPFKDLGLIVIDEEHEVSYKQHEPAPRYHARDCALWMARQMGAGIVLGSATPSMESFHHAQERKYHLVALNERFSGTDLPEIKVLNLAKAMSLDQMHGPLIGEARQAASQAMTAGNQVLIFRNRRGYSPTMICQNCGFTESCDYCDVSMTYHKQGHELRCHYCGTGYRPHDRCSNCNHSAWMTKGTGTERIEEDMAELFPTARLLRIDSDSTRKKQSLSQFVAWLESGEVDMVIGTQILGKGLDVSGMALAIILDADVLLQWPDFRAFERAYQMLTQVAGRTGRRQTQGKVFIQSYTPDHPILDHVIKGSYQAMAEDVLRDRKAHHYPPFVRLIRLELRHKQANRVREAALVLVERLSEAIGGGVLGPDAPSIARIKNHYLQHVWVKLSTTGNPKHIKLKIRNTINGLQSQPDYRSVKVVMDVDPQ
ncbi:MAG: primosomal protein N' [Schleiferiaceae bacterium]|nr:primosomal protein N' [Schleiferiaceae bacterium]MDO7601862.1 primosomal protein N' [Schleiferiaceae bacterium]MDO7690750.1 primosomal protein N' [Schleiferiaceae bacterium]